MPGRRFQGRDIRGLVHGLEYELVYGLEYGLVHGLFAYLTTCQLLYGHTFTIAKQHSSQLVSLKEIKGFDSSVLLYSIIQKLFVRRREGIYTFIPSDTLSIFAESDITEPCATMTNINTNLSPA